MNNLTKIAALPTGGGCQSALRPEDRGAAFATVGWVSPGLGLSFTVVYQGAEARKINVTLEDWAFFLAPFEINGEGI